MELLIFSFLLIFIKIFDIIIIKTRGKEIKMLTTEMERYLEVLAEIKDCCLQSVTCENCPLSTAKVCNGEICPYDWKI